MQGPGEGRRRARRASIFSVTLQRASWVLLVHSLSARWANGSGDGGGGRLGGRKGGCGLGDGGGGGGVDDTVQNWQLSWQLAMIGPVLHLVILSMSVLNSRWHFSASLSTHAGRDGNGGDGSEPGGGGGEGDGGRGGLGEGDGSGDGGGGDDGSWGRTDAALVPLRSERNMQSLVKVRAGLGTGLGI